MEIRRGDWSKGGLEWSEGEMNEVKEDLNGDLTSIGIKSLVSPIPFVQS
jgi:hypothetical protein